MRPIKLSKKEWGLAVLGICLALGSTAPSDPWVFGPMLAVSWATCLFLAYHHEGRRRSKIVFALIMTGFLGGIAYRNLTKRTPAFAHVLAYWVGQNSKNRSQIIANVYVENGEQPFTVAVYTSAGVRLATTDNAEVTKATEMVRRDAAKKAADGGGLNFPFAPHEKIWFTVEGPTFSGPDMKTYLDGKGMFIFAGEVMQSHVKVPVAQFCGWVLGNQQGTIFECPEK